MSTASSAAEDSLIGSRIDGRYTLHRVLGQGGMGVVYEGVHDELGRAVAIKVLNAAWATDRTAVERFLREARTASSFSHSNIVDVSDLGRLADGRPYLVMPKISGIDMATLLAENGPQPAKRVAALLSGVASALDLVHSKGFVHRDIKPENLMYVVRDDGSETVMLLDFGIAAAVMSSGPRLTRQGAIFGTPHYLPPEVCTGERCDARGDVYSLASVAFEMITGMLPFGTDDIMQLMAQKVSYDAPPLSAVSGTKFPPELEQVIATGLARDPRYRYSSASMFVNALRVATNSAPVSWRSGVVRPNLHSSEHELPPPAALSQAVERPWGDAERAPTWPVDSVRPGEPGHERGTASQPSYPSPPRSGFAPRRTPSPYTDESSTVRAAGYSTPAPGYSAPSHTPTSGRMPAPTANPGVWGVHAHPRTPYPSQESSYEARLRVLEDERRATVAVKSRKSVAPVVIGVCAFAALGMGAVHWITNKRSVQTEQSQPSASAPPPSRPAQPAAATPRSAAPSVLQPSAAAPAATLRPAPSQSTSQLQSPTAAVSPQQLPAPGSADAVKPSAGVVPSYPPQVDDALAASEHPESATSPEQAAAPAAQRGRAGRERSRATSPSSSPPVPAASTPSPSPASASPQEPQPAAASGSSVLSVTPITPDPEPAHDRQVEAEPEPRAPATDAAAAADLSKRSSASLLRGEVTKAVDLARQATQADPGYAIAWRSLGLALERAGAADQALQAYSQYLQRAPTGPQADMVRQRMQGLSP